MAGQGRRPASRLRRWWCLKAILSLLPPTFLAVAVLFWILGRYFTFIVGGSYVDDKIGLRIGRSNAPTISFCLFPSAPDYALYIDRTGVALTTWAAPGLRPMDRGKSGIGIYRWRWGYFPPQAPSGPMGIAEQVGIEHWLLTSVAAILSLRWLLRRRTHSPGHCAACGYDLRGTPDRCPECGRATDLVARASGT